MNTFVTISTLMTDYKHLVTVGPEDTLLRVQEIFNANKFHHIPVVRFREIVGLISKSDFQQFMGAASLFQEDAIAHESRLKLTRAKDIMTTGLGKVEPSDRLNVALEIFCGNWFHALPVVDNDELVGILTPYDILKALAEQKIDDPSLVYETACIL